MVASKRLRTICNGKCQQARNAKEKRRKAIAHQQRQANEQEEAANRQAAARLAHQERVRAKTSRQNAAKAFIMAPPQRSDKKCPHLINEKGVGTCSRGLRCRYDHTFFGPPEMIATIPCGLELRPGGAKCSLGDMCIYHHPNPEDSVPYSPAPSSLQGETETRRAPPPPSPGDIDPSVGPQGEPTPWKIMQAEYDPEFNKDATPIPTPMQSGTPPPTTTPQHPFNE